MDRIVIYGCGGHARSIINTLRQNDENMEILLVDENACNGEVIMGCKVVRDYKLGKNDGYIIAVGDNEERARLCQLISKQHRGHCISVVSRYSCIGKESEIGFGTFISANTYIGPLAKIGNNSIVNTGSIIEHETIVGNNAHIAPGATICGRAQIGNNVFCGAGSVIIDKVKICDNVTIGAGAVVIHDVMDEGTYVGVPAKIS